MDPRFNYPDTPSSSIPTKLASAALVIYAVHYLLRYFDIPILSPQELLWNALVFILPERLLLDAGRRQELRANGMLSQRHAVKGDALRRALGLGGNAILQGLPSGEGVGSIMRRASSNITGAGAGAGKSIVLSDAPAGLGNWDNSCYQNSVLQALSSLGSLRNWLPVSEPSETGTTNSSLQEMIAKLRDPSNNGRHIWTPAKLKNMSSWQQQDAQEYFSKIMDELDREAARTLEASVEKPGLEVVLESEKDNQETEEERTRRELRNPLEGLVAQRVACTKCGFSEGFSMIPFNCLTVPLGSNYVYDLEECLDEYTKSEDIEGVECRSCTLLHAESRLKQLDLPPELRGQIAKRLEAIERALAEDDFSDKSLKQDCQIPAKAYVSSMKSREALIGRAPPSLVIHVNRSVFDEMTGTQRKNYAQVRYPLILDLGPWMLGMDGIPARYRLSAAVTHYGRHENGHYICYRKHPRAAAREQVVEDEPTPTKEFDNSEEIWWRLSDEDVSEVTEQDVLEQAGVFMLFYEHIPEANPPAMDEDLLAAAAIPLPPDEAADWEMLDVKPSSTATPSLVTSASESVVSESDTDATDLDDLDAAVDGKLLFPHAPILKTATPAVQHEMGMNRSLMSV